MTQPEVKTDSRWISGQEIPDIVTVGDPRLREIAKRRLVIERLKPLCDKLANQKVTSRRAAAPWSGARGDSADHKVDRLIVQSQQGREPSNSHLHIARQSLPPYA
jgi:hypothetical protein